VLLVLGLFMAVSGSLRLLLIDLQTGSHFSDDNDLCCSDLKS